MDVCVCVCVQAFIINSPLAGQVYNVTDVVVLKKKKNPQQLCVRWLGHMTTAACDWPGRWAKNAWRNPRLMSFLGDSDSEWTQQERIPERILTEKESLKRLKEGEREYKRRRKQNGG